MKRARFIAGARCRACGEVDRIVVEETPDVRTQRCMACGHREGMRVDELERSATVIRVVSSGDGSDTENR